MSVPTPFRNPLQPELDVELKCRNLYTHTLHMIDPKSKTGAKAPKILKSRLEKSSYDALSSIHSANKKNLNDERERIERLKLQMQAKTHLNEHMTALVAFHGYRRLPDKKCIYWNDMIEEVERILNGWIRSDERRVAELSSSEK